MFDLAKQSSDQFILTVQTKDDSIPMLISRRDLLLLWNKIADIIVDDK